MLSFYKIKPFIGKKVNVHLRNGDVIVNVLLDEVVVKSAKNSRKQTITIKHNSKKEEIPLFKVVAITRVLM